MTEQDLKRMKWGGILEEIDSRDREIRRLNEENESLKEENSDLKERISDRKINIEKSGSIAEASLKLNKVFEDAQAAADQYLQNIKEKEAEAEKLIKELTDRTDAACRAKQENTDAKCDLLVSESKKRAEEYWKGKSV